MISCTAIILLGALSFYLADIIAPNHSFIVGILLYISFTSLYSAFFSHKRVRVHTYNQHDFSESLLILCAAVIKADGHFKRSELDYLRDYFTRSLGSAQAHQSLLRLNEIMDENYNIESVCYTLRSRSSINERLLIVQFLFGLADADGELHPLEVAEIQRIASAMGVSNSDYESIKSMFVGGYNRSYNSAGPRPTRDINNDYKILEISPEASDDEVKKAYRTLAKKYHPDRVAHLGDEMKKQAEEKFARLSEAYDNIKKARGMK